MIRIPNPDKRRALIVVDVEPGFIRKEDEPVVRCIKTLLKEIPYAAYIEAVFGSEGNPLWKKETHWHFPLEETRNDVSRALPKNHLRVTKSTKSIFKGDADVTAFLKGHDIEEVHVVGFDINDCVFATAQESFDLGFSTYVIEECCGSSERDLLKREAIDLLRENEMTNHSVFIGSFQEIITP